LLYLSDQKALFVDELLVLGAVLEEGREEAQELLAVADQDLLHRMRLVWVGDENLESQITRLTFQGGMYLEDMKTLVIDHFPVVSQQLHDDLEVFARVDVLCHDIVVGPIEQNLAQQLDGLTLRHIAVRLYQH
jgi:hypothetical protein